MLSPLYSASGFVIGFLVGATGVGGGSLMTPLLVLAFGIHPQTAVGTDLIYASVTKGVGAAVHGARRSVNWGLVGLLASGSLPATLVSVIVLHHIGPAGPRAAHLISIVLGSALFGTAASLLLKNQLAALARRSGARSKRSRATLTIATGAVVGVLVTFSSVGAGAIGVTALFFLFPELSTAEIVGSDVVHAVPLTLAAGIGHLFLGSIDGRMLLSLLAGSIPGVIIGSLCASRAPDRYLRPALAAVLLIVGGQLLFG